ncbi:MAG TPA: glycogen synthase GlgA [Candidatus Binatia bacterium]|nr:glycogen synthase GlgA [Candidatus Binatia bacterium]
MKIAMLSPEIAPFAKTGGLADMVSALANALARQGHELCLIMPAYRSVFLGDFSFEEPSVKVSVPHCERSVETSVLRVSSTGSSVVYLVRADHYYDREQLYGTPEGDYSDNAERFAFFNRAALEILRQWQPDIIHCHDWHTALAPVFLKIQAERYPELAGAKTVFTVHNMAFQGIFGPDHWEPLGLPWDYFAPQFLEYYGNINFLKGGLLFADKVTTVSPSYACEIQEMEQGFGLDGVLRARADCVVGILNGVDDREWNPKCDPHIAKSYNGSNPAAKRQCKKALQRLAGLPEESGVPLLALLCRLASQQGMDLVEQILDPLLECDVQWVVVGAGEPRYEKVFAEAAKQYPKKIAFKAEGDELLTHRILAGADILLMPSRYEPCGLQQLFALKYGTIPVVHAVGGLKDSVADYQSKPADGTGFLFAAYDARALLGAIDQALQVYRNKRAWSGLRKRAMSRDFSSDRSAEEYTRVYRELMA